MSDIPHNSNPKRRNQFFTTLAQEVKGRYKQNVDRFLAEEHRKGGVVIQKVLWTAPGYTPPAAGSSLIEDTSDTTLKHEHHQYLGRESKHSKSTKSKNKKNQKKHRVSVESDGRLIPEEE